MKKDIKVIVFTDSGNYNYFPETLDCFLNYWKEKFDLIPLQYRSIACIKLEAANRWEYDSGIDIEIYYYRQETDEEYNKRLDEENHIKATKEQTERDLLKKLKEKYGE